MMRVYRDSHHLLHHRQEWSLRPEAAAIREHPSLIPRMNRELHEELHRKCPPVPLLGFYALKRTLSVWRPQQNVLDSLDGLVVAIEDAARHEKSHPIESELAHLAISALELQRPFIELSLQEGEPCMAS